MARKLASIQKIDSLKPIESADRIEIAHVLGWQCVVNKGQFKPVFCPLISAPLSMKIVSNISVKK